MTSAWKPDRDEAQFLGEVLNIDAGLAKIVRDQLEKGIPLRQVRATLKDALNIVRAIQP